MERNVSVRTPESIAFYYELAGLGSRFLAVAIDLVLQSLTFIALALLAAWASPATASLAKAIGLSETALSAIEIGVVVIFAFLIYFGYFIAFETLWNGQTPGKRAIGIRVVRDGGYPLNFMDAVIRNLIRVIEAALAYLPSIVSAVISAQNKRLGDLAAGTIVVRDRAFEVPDPAKWVGGDTPDRARESLAGIESLTDDEFALAERYVARSHMLEPQAAWEIAKRIADAVRPKLGTEVATLSDHDLLVRIASGRPR